MNLRDDPTSSEYAQLYQATKSAKVALAWLQDVAYQVALTTEERDDYEDAMGHIRKLQEHLQGRRDAGRSR